MTYERVLDAFAEFLEQDPETEVVLTRHGYTVMSWNEKSKDWIFVHHCATPSALKKTLANSYEGLLEHNTTKGVRDLTKQEQSEIKEKIALLVNKCKAEA